MSYSRWFVLVYWNPAFSTSDFCVAKYEMTYSDNATLNTTNTSRATLAYNTNKTLVSVWWNYPITNLNQTQAIQQCRKGKKFIKIYKSFLK